MPLAHLIVLDGEYRELIDSYACTECGHMELYAKPEELKKVIECNKRAEEKMRAIASYQKELDGLMARQSELESFIQDEEQSVRSIREAKEELSSLGSEISSVRSKIASLRASGLF